MEDKEKFLSILKELVAEENSNLESFSKIIGINIRSIRRWYTSCSPKLSSLIKIADHFNCSIDFLIGRTENVEFKQSVPRENFLARYNSLKKEQNLNDYKIALVCRIGTSTVSKWKEGRTPDFEILVKLCDLFECSMDFLVGRAEY